MSLHPFTSRWKDTKFRNIVLFIEYSSTDLVMRNVIWNFQNRLESVGLCNEETVFSVKQGLNYKYHLDILQAPNCLNWLHCPLSPMSIHFCMFLNNALAACRIRVGHTRVKYKNAHVSHLYLRRMYI